MYDIPPILEQLQAQHRYRAVKTRTGPQQALIQIDGTPYLNFCSNDYLGLSNHPAVIQRFIQAAQTYGVGSGAAHLVNGHTDIHHQLENAIAEFTGRDKAVLFSTGYMANLGVASALLQENSAVFEDRLNHASLIDAGLLAKARFKRYAHLDVAALDKQLASTTQPHRLIMTDGVFSMDGDAAPVTALSQLAKQHDAWLMVDDAHGIGTLGDSGGGLLQQHGLSQNDVPLLVITFGKALGTSGACVAGPSDLMDLLVQRARSYIYTTAMPPAIAAATLASLQIIQAEPERRQTLQDNIALFKQGLAEQGIHTQSNSAIQPIILGSDQAAIAASQQLNDAGILVTAIRPPTVPKAPQGCA